MYYFYPSTLLHPPILFELSQSDPIIVVSHSPQLAVDLVEPLLEFAVAVVEAVDEPRVRRVAAAVRRAQLLQPARNLRVRGVRCKWFRIKKLSVIVSSVTSVDLKSLKNGRNITL